MTTEDDSNHAKAATVTKYLHGLIAEVFGNHRHVQLAVPEVRTDGMAVFAMTLSPDAGVRGQSLGMNDFIERLKAFLSSSCEIKFGVGELAGDGKMQYTCRIIGPLKKLEENTMTARVLDNAAYVAKQFNKRMQSGADKTGKRDLKLNSVANVALPEDEDSMRVHLKFAGHARQTHSILEPLEGDLGRLFPSAREFIIRSLSQRSGRPEMELSFVGKLSDLARDLDRYEVPFLIKTANDAAPPFQR